MPRNWNAVAMDSEGKYTVDDFKQSFHQLLTHQCLYRRFMHQAVAYRLISAHRADYQEAAELAGYRLIFKDNYEFCCVVPETTKHALLDLQQTVFLLVLRRLYHEHASVGNVTAEGDAVVTINELVTTYEEISGRPLDKAQSVLKGLVKAAWGSGLAKEIEPAEGDPQPFAVAVLPGISEVLSENAVGRFGAQLKAALAVAGVDPIDAAAQESAADQEAQA